MTKEVLEKANKIDRQLELIHEYLIQSSELDYRLNSGEFQHLCDRLGIESQVLEILVTKEKALQKEFNEL